MRALHCCLSFVAISVVACGGESATTDAGPGDGGTPVDGTVGADAAPSPLDASPADAPDEAEAEAAVPTTYNDIADPSNWEVFDLSSWLGMPHASFATGAFDGRYIYYIPSFYDTGPANILVRFDTTGSFTDAASWSKYDLTQVNADAIGFFGAAFIGKSLYFVPSQLNRNQPLFSGFAAEYDTTGGFTTPASYSLFDLTTIPPASSSVAGYAGGTFDGQYLYFAPWQTTVAVRYDTTGAFGATGAWSKFDLSALSIPFLNLRGATFDGQYVYYAPVSGPFIRYDTKAPFSNPSSWASASPGNLGPQPPVDYFGVTFDGRYVYYAPLLSSNPNQDYSNTIVRYDTQGTGFSEPASWTTMTASSYGFCGAVFDGRYVTFIPGGFTSTTQGFYRINRYDTTGSFTSPSSWSDFGLDQLPQTNVASGGKNYGYGWRGGAFDGQYLYLVPGGAPALRFKVKSPASMPSTYTGSFF